MIRKATVNDIKAVHELLSIYGRKGVLLARPLSELYDHVRDFSVFVDPETHHVVGCGALQFCWEDLAEIRSLAVHPDHTGKGIGTDLSRIIIAEAREYKIKQLFALTYRPGFFKKFGFSRIRKAELPLKIWSDCIICVKFPDCDEIAMMRPIDH